MKTLITIACLISLIFLTACGEEDNPVEKTPLRIAFAPSTMQGEYPYTLTVTVTGEGMEEMKAETTFTGKKASIDLEIPTGLEREFTAEIVDKNGILLYYGEKMQSLSAEEPVTVSIPITLITQMVLIPAGEFSMGDHHDVGYDDEKPVHTVYLDAFYIDKYEVTVGQYKKFIQATGHQAPNWSSVSNNSPTDNHPMIYVSWHDAAAYAQWAGKRLPTEAQWEKAARGGLVGKKYPWGDKLTHDDANYRGTGGKDKWNGTSPVGSFPPNGYGLYDMAGNVWEWCADEYDPGYYSKSIKNNPKGPGTPILFVNNDFTNIKSSRVLRGGTWYYHYYYLRCAYRFNYVPTYGDFNVGFRCRVPAED